MSQPEPDKNMLRMILRNKIKAKTQSRTGSFSYENHLQKLKVPTRLCDKILESLKYTGNVCPYPDELMKTFDKLSDTDIDGKCAEIDAFIKSRSKK